MRVLLGLLAAILVHAAGWSAASAQSSVLDEIRQRGELRIAGVLYRPLISPRPNGQYVGIDVELMNVLAQELGVRLRVVPAEWATAVAGIQSRQWDIVPALCITPPRREVVDFSPSYITIGATLTALASNPLGLNNVEAFNRPEVTFAVPAGSWSESVAREVAPRATIRSFGQTTSADLIQEVVAGRADAVVLDTPIQTTVALEAFGNRLRIVPGHNQPLDVRACQVGYAYAKGDTRMAELLNGFVQRMRDSGQLRTLVDRFMTAEQIRAAN